MNKIKNYNHLVYALLGDGECKKAKTGEAGMYASAVDNWCYRFKRAANWATKMFLTWAA
jgi:hypothetical protein